MTVRQGAADPPYFWHMLSVISPITDRAISDYPRQDPIPENPLQPVKDQYYLILQTSK